ncbi:MAG TPA: hypothetical protein VKG44_07010 [Candidatus Baltobacteraceae bacterium]|nr:hypothetical protein [Candidatus Baltobacteraceae bacterium]
MLTKRKLFCAVLAAATLSACQGSLGSGSGLPQPPAAYAPQNPQANGAAQTAYTRMRTLEGAVFLVPGSDEIPLPALGGFEVVLDLHPTPTPAPSASPAASGAAAQTASPTPKASATPSPSASPTPNSAASGRRPSPAPSGLKFETKMTIYPSDAPLAPSPEPSGNVQTFPRRTALVRGSLLPGADVTLPSLGAVRFTIPKEEQISGRAFVVALFESAKHKTHLIAFSGNTVLNGGVVTAAGTNSAIKLKKGGSYSLLLFADELPPTPPPTLAPGATYPPQPTASPAAQFGQPYPSPSFAPGQPTPTPSPYYIGPH